MKFLDALGILILFSLAACNQAGLQVSSKLQTADGTVCDINCSDNGVQSASCSVVVTTSALTFPLNASNQLAQHAQISFDLTSTVSRVTDFKELQAGFPVQLVTPAAQLQELSNRKNITLAFNEVGPKRMEFTVQASEDPRSRGTCEVAFEIRGTAVGSTPVSPPKNPPAPPPAVVVQSKVDIKVNGQDGPVDATYNESVDVTWTSENVLNCSIAPWALTEGAGTKRVSVVTTSVLSIACDSPGGRLTDTVTVNLPEVTLTSTRNTDGATNPICLYGQVNGSPVQLLGCNSKITPNPWPSPKLPLPRSKCNVISLKAVAVTFIPIASGNFGRSTVLPADATKYFRFVKLGKSSHVVRVSYIGGLFFMDLDLTLTAPSDRPFIFENSGANCD